MPAAGRRRTGRRWSRGPTAYRIISRFTPPSRSGNLPPAPGRMRITVVVRGYVRRAMRALSVAAAVVAAAHASAAFAASGDIVLYASDVTVVQGNWKAVASSYGAAGLAMQSTDAGWSTTDAARALPADYFEASFSASAGVRYHVWLRLRATGDTKYNDSVWVQFSDAADAANSPIYAIGSASALLVNLENCSGCGMAGAGWQDKGYWLQQSAVVQFASAGMHRIRVQTREDGVQVDQIVLSPSAYMSTSPGQLTNDATIVAKSTTAPSPAGAAAVIPGAIEAEAFDTGGEGVSYHDSTAANSGGAFRSTDVDIEPASSG